MTLFRTDRLYEEAARTPDGIDKLLKQLQRARRSYLVALLGLCGLVLAFCVVVIYSADQALHNSSPESSGWLSAPIVWVVVGPLLTGVFFEFVMMANCDSQIKMLLFLRHQKIDSGTEVCGDAT